MSTKSMFDMKFPVQTVHVDFAMPYVGNDSIVWAGQIAVLVDADGDAYQSSALSFDTPWYHCAACLANGVPTHRARLSIGQKFCPECGTALDWDNTAERDPEADRAFRADLRERIDKAKASPTESETPQ